MGCHTWFYKKMNIHPSREQAIEDISKSQKQWIDRYARIKTFLEQGKKDELEEWERDCVETYDFMSSPEALQESIDQILVEMEKMKSEPFDDIMRMYASFLCNFDTTGVVIYRNGNFYKNKENGKEIHSWDVFRTYNYPEDTLTCYEDFLKFWETHECFPGHKFEDGKWLEMSEEEVKEEMKKFWEQYPDGIVNFG